MQHLRSLIRLSCRVKLSPRFLAVFAALVLAQAAHAVAPPPAYGRHGMVVTTQHLATEVGLKILKEGGNAIDAAVAVGYTLAVVDPCCGNIGGGGFMTLHLADGRNIFVNFRERAPLKATRDMYLDAKGNVVPGRSTRGYLAVGVPGTVMGLDTVLREYGTMTRQQVMAPAIGLAEHGFVLQRGDVDIMTGSGKQGDLDALRGPSKLFAQEPNIAAIFLKHGKPYQVGDRLVQTNLAHTLRLIEKDGAKAFYKGPIADAIVKASNEHGGILSKADFENYFVEQTKPVECDYHGYHVISAPPPSSGGTTLCEILNIIEPYPLAKMGFHSAAATHVMVEAMRHAYVDRNTLLGDPDYVKAPIARLISKDYAARIRASIKPDQATPSSEVKQGVAPHEGTNTTHFSIVDDKGNAVSTTYTINNYFGANVMAGNTGFFLNDEMDDFTSKVGVPNLYGLIQGENNAIAPGKRPLSSMTPSIATKDGKLFMVFGSPGGSRIITIALEVFSDVVDYGMNVQEAVDAPRFHHQWQPDVIQYEPYAFSQDTIDKLKAMGYHFKAYGPWGAAEAIVVDPATGMLTGGTDQRHPAGAAMGY
ncbi:MAG: gamma-glutamyltransferase [Burkholderiales bacterium]|nr:gamma-glutamyltransferase [Burkholderiales bacterium]TAL54242.1 MAG: gamma-glutamyltransferase [Pandoraea sp.]TAM15885.1 MAG: gamma-glutamyltransferase [Pandoraea sp.]